MVEITPGTLSKGFRQRVGLAQAIVHDPPVLILDEPTVGLDPLQIQEIRDLIGELAGSGGGQHAIVLSTHILAEVEAICRRVIMIHQGRKAVDAPLAELTADEERFVRILAWASFTAARRYVAIVGDLVDRPAPTGREVRAA